uniref:Uncharacterized protein n=1 Tax=Arundo donax TaxID=35708 RepID=A0A0A8YWG1_ARUDO
MHHRKHISSIDDLMLWKQPLCCPLIMLWRHPRKQYNLHPLNPPF